MLVQQKTSKQAIRPRAHTLLELRDRCLDKRPAFTDRAMKRVGHPIDAAAIDVARKFQVEVAS